MSKDVANRLAYADVCDCLPPRTDDEEYLAAYRAWWPLGWEAQRCEDI